MDPYRSRVGHGESLDSSARRPGAPFGFHGCRATRVHADELELPMVNDRSQRMDHRPAVNPSRSVTLRVEPRPVDANCPWRYAHDVVNEWRKSKMGRQMRRDLLRKSLLRKVALMSSAALFAGPLLNTAPSSAASFIVVTTTADDMTNNGNCTLREAVRAADTDRRVDQCAPGSGADTIELSGATYRLRKGELKVGSNVTVVGIGKDTVIDGRGETDRGFHVLAGGYLRASRLTVTRTKTAFRNDGHLALTTVRAIDNSFDAGDPINNNDAPVFAASGVDNRGHATIESSVFALTHDVASSVQIVPSFINAKPAATTSIVDSVIRGVDFGNAYLAWSGVLNHGDMRLRGVTFDHVAASSTACTVLENWGGKLVASHVRFVHGATCYSTGSSLYNTGDAVVDHMLVDGGDAEVVNTGSLRMTDSILRNLNANRASGAAINNGGTLELERTSIRDNTEMQGVLVNYAGVANLVDVTMHNNIGSNSIYSNTGLEGAGGIDNYATLTGRNLKITHNSYPADQTDPLSSGGILNRPGATLNLADSTVAENENVDYDGLEVSPDCFGNINSLGGNSIKHVTSGCTIVAVP